MNKLKNKLYSTLIQYSNYTQYISVKNEAITLQEFLYDENLKVYKFEPIFDLSMEEMKNLASEYSDYVTYYCDFVDIFPVSIMEFFDNDYQEISKSGDTIRVKESDCKTALQDWIKENPSPLYIIKASSIYKNNSVWVVGCPYTVKEEEFLKVV